MIHLSSKQDHILGFAKFVLHYEMISALKTLEIISSVSKASLSFLLLTKDGPIQSLVCCIRQIVTKFGSARAESLGLRSEL